VDIPIIVRSLADSLALADASVLPLSFEPDLLATLDIGVDDDSKCRKVSTYHHAWWLVRKPRNLDSVDIMDRSSIDKCLDIYQHLLLPSQRGEVITSGSTSTGPLALPVPPAPQAPILSLLEAGCNQCECYRDLLSGILRELVGVCQFASAMATASENQWCLDMRRASTFNLLYEATVIKECGPSTRPPRGNNKGERAKAVEDRAREELQCLQALPPSSHKWTWGEQLTKAEVLGLARSGTRLGKIHSGYDVSLKDGKNSGQDSFVGSLPTSHGRFDDVPEELLTSLPDATLAGPSYFTNFQHRFYDPLSLRVPEGDSVSPSAYRCCGLLAGIAEAADMPAAPALAMPPSAPSPPVFSLAPTPPAPPAHGLLAPVSPLEPAPALSSVPFLGDDWSSGSDENGSSGSVGDVVAGIAKVAQVAQASALALALAPAPALPLSAPLSTLPTPSAPAASPSHARPAPAMPLEPASALSVPILADVWSSGTDEEGEVGPAEEWSSASGNESGAIPAVADVVDNWSSASQGSGSDSNS